MIGSMIVGFLIGLIASAISNRGVRRGCCGAGGDEGVSGRGQRLTRFGGRRGS